MRQMLNQLRILHHIVLAITINISLSVLRDRPQLNSQRIPRQSVVLHGVVVPAGTVKKLSTAKNRPVRQIQPKILGLVALLALPTRRGYFYAVVELGEALRVFGDQAGLAIPGSGQGFELGELRRRLCV